MKCKYYGTPSKALPEALIAGATKVRWLRFPAVALMLLAWMLLMPLAWLAIRAGEIGHAVAGWCGFDSRDWE